MARQQRIISATGIYHIMLRGNERKNIFADREDKQRFLEDVAIKRKEIGFSLYAHCLMDNHIHLLLNTMEIYLPSIMKGIGVRYAYFYNTKHKRVGHVFQDRFRSEPVEDERYLLAVMRYIHNNPVKARIVEKAEEYPWSSYSSYIEPKKEGLVDTQFIFEILSHNKEMAIEEFKRFSNETDDAQYLDISDEKEIRSIEYGQDYLKNYLQEKWAGQTLEEVLPSNRKKVIEDLRLNTRLSVRTIAQLLGVNRNVVERIRNK